MRKFSSGSSFMKALQATMAVCLVLAIVGAVAVYAYRLKDISHSVGRFETSIGAINRAIEMHEGNIAYLYDSYNEHEERIRDLLEEGIPAYQGRLETKWLEEDVEKTEEARGENPGGKRGERLEEGKVE